MMSQILGAAAGHRKWWRYQRAALILILCVTAGCRTVPPAPSEQPLVYSTLDVPFAIPCHANEGDERVQCSRPTVASTDCVWHLQRAQAAFTSAQQLEEQPSESCVDQYYQTVTEAWHCMSALECADTIEYIRVWDIYHRGLERLIISSQQHGRLDPRSGLTVNTSNGVALVPIAYHGLPWQPEDFSQLLPADGQGSHSLKKYWHHSGLGVPLVALRIRDTDDRFMASKMPWATTAVLRPKAAASPPSSDTTPSHVAVRCQTTPPVVATLELHDPLRRGTTRLGMQNIAIHRDLSAPMAFLTKNADRGWLNAFLRPGTSKQQSALRMLEPYQPGKIPVIFVHGLLSDPSTWVEVANEMRAVPWIVDRYQIWAYRYPTGEAFLDSAAKFRELLYEAVATCDPAGNDRALQEIVLVGHSMGGLIAKLQVTYSELQLWDSVANRPLESIHAAARARKQLERIFFFDPQPSVTRVVFVGTPHRGSSWARRSIGRPRFASGR